MLIYNNFYHRFETCGVCIFERVNALGWFTMMVVVTLYRLMILAYGLALHVPPAGPGFRAMIVEGAG